MEEDLVKQGADLSPEAKQEKEGGIRQKLMTYRRHVEELEGEVQTKKRELLSDFTTKIEQVVREIAEKEQITLVMEKGDAGPGTLIMYSEPSINLTDRVIKAIESKGEYEGDAHESYGMDRVGCVLPRGLRVRALVLSR